MASHDCILRVVLRYTCTRTCITYIFSCTRTPDRRRLYINHISVSRIHQYMYLLTDGACLGVGNVSAPLSAAAIKNVTAHASGRCAALRSQLDRARRRASPACMGGTDRRSISTQSLLSLRKRGILVLSAIDRGDWAMPSSIIR